MAYLELRKVKKQFGTVTAVQDFNLDVERVPWSRSLDPPAVARLLHCA